MDTRTVFPLEKARAVGLVRNAFKPKDAFRLLLAISFILFAVFGTACRTNQISDAARIHSQSSSGLVSWLNPDNRPADLKDRDPFFDQAIFDELVARRQVDFLIGSFNSATNEEIRTLLASGVLSQINDRRIYDAFLGRLSDEEDLESWYFANYLAERGNATALATLNRHYFQYPVASYMWASTVDIFGKQRYRPAITNLVGSLDAASFNLSGAACNALEKFFPDSPTNFASLEDAKAYFVQRVFETPQ